MTWRHNNLIKARETESAYQRRVFQLPDSERPESKTKLYKIYHSIKQRCYNSRSKDYHNYGERGIKLDSSFGTFAQFKAWALSHGYMEGLTIDRIDNNGDYSVNNCRWIARAENIAKSNTTRIGRY